MSKIEKKSQEIIEKVQNLTFSDFENAKNSSIADFVWSVFEGIEKTEEEEDNLPYQVFETIDSKILELTENEERLSDWYSENPYEEYGVSQKDFY